MHLARPAMGAILATLVATMGPAYGGSIEEIGNVPAYHFTITTQSAPAQAYFNHAMVMFYAYNYTEAERLFRLAEVEDPTCAMCLWGTAMAKRSQGLELRLTTPPEASPWMARAVALGGAVSATERDLIRASAQAFQRTPPERGEILAGRFLAAMTTLRDTYPKSADVWALSIDAQMGVPPASGPKHHCGGSYDDAILPLIEQGLERFPNHPGLLHYHLHLQERTADMRPSKQSAERLPGFGVSQIGHFYHMPTHYYWRIGDYEACVAANKQAIAADVQYFRMGGVGLLTYYYEYHYLHSYHFLWWLGAAQGDRNMAVQNADYIVEHTVPSHLASIPTYLDALRATKIAAHAKFGEWSAVLAIEPMDGEGALAGVWRTFARALAFLNLGQQPAYATERAKLDQLCKPGSQAAAAVKTWADLGRNYLQGVAFMRNKKWAESVAPLERAVAIEDTLPRDYPPEWIFWSAIQLAEAYKQLGQHDKAREALAPLLQRYPKLPEAAHALTALAP